MGAPLLTSELGGGGAAAGAGTAALAGSGYAMVGLAAFQVWSGLQAGDMMRAQGDLNLAIAESNAKYAEKEAWEAEVHGYTIASRYKTTIDKTISQQNVAHAVQNVDPNIGTSKQIQGESKLAGYLNQLDIRKQARSKALGLKFQASNLRLGGYTNQLQSEVNATATEQAAIIGAVGTGISGYRRLS